MHAPVWYGRDAAEPFAAYTNVGVIVPAATRPWRYWSGVAVPPLSHLPDRSIVPV